MIEISPAIRRLCTAIRIGGALFVVGVLAIYVVTWMWPPVHAHAHSMMPRIHLAGIPANSLSELSALQRLMIALVSLPYLAALTWAFYRLDKLLRGFSRGEFFEAATVGHLRAFSGYLLLAKLLSLLAMHVRVGVLAQMLGHHDFRTLVNLSSDDMSVLLMCGLFFLIARMMEEGRRLAEENRGFV